jgi:hypothetical protein
MKRATTAADFISYSETLTAPQLAVHGPLQRLLEDAVIGTTVRVRLRCGKPRRHSLPLARHCAGNKATPRLARSATGAAAADRVCVGARPALEQRCRQPHAPKECAKRRVFGSCSELLMSFKTSLVADSNGEVEGPPRSARSSATGARCLQRPWRGHADRSRSPPTIVRRLIDNADAGYHHGPHQDEGVHSQANLVQKLSPNFIAP